MRKICTVALIGVMSLSALTSVQANELDANNIDEVVVENRFDGSAPDAPINDETYQYNLADVMSLVPFSSKVSRARRSLSVSYLDLLAYGNQYVGLPYVWGGRYPSQGGFDCIGLIMHMLNNVAGTNYDLMYTNAAAFYARYCYEIPKSEVRPGDLVFYRGTYGSPNVVEHVGFYVGNDTMLNAGDPIGYANIYKLRSVWGNYVPPFFARIKDVNISLSHEPGWYLNQFSNQWYYFGEDRNVVTGWKEINGVTYYFNMDGTMKTGWLLDNNKWYFFDSNGGMQKGWINLGNAPYYLDQDGVMLTGAQTIDGLEYYFLSSGQQAVGLTSREDGDYHYLQEGGFLKDAWDENYYYDETGKRDETQVVQKWVKGASGWWYRHSDLSYTTNDFEVIDGETYYFNSIGYRITGWKQVDGKWYFFDNDGRMQKSKWVQSFYFNDQGQWDENKVYPHWMKNSIGWWYVTEDGSYPRDTLFNIGNNTFYFNQVGYMVTGWKLIDDKWYFFDSSGYMKKNAWANINGLWYFFDSEGKMVTGWVETPSATFYFADDGHMVTGWKQIDGKWYFFNQSGQAVKNQYLKGFYFDQDGVWISQAN